MASDERQWIEYTLHSLKYWNDAAENKKLEVEVWIPPPDPSRAHPVVHGQTGIIDNIEVADRCDLPSDYYTFYGLDPLPSSRDHPRAFEVLSKPRQSRDRTHEGLDCITCGKTWRRRIRPGGKPHECPSCRNNTRETLTCSDCGRDWERGVIPGRKPRYCPNCSRKPISPRQPPYTRWDDTHDLLECTECGDLWLRERKRGLKPLTCPNC